MSGRVLLLGSTDLTLTVADAVLAAGAQMGAIVHVGEAFKISYAPTAVRNYRGADIPAWCDAHSIPAISYQGVPALSRAVAGGGYVLCILAGWYHMVPRPFREMFVRGCVGFHASLLPKLRGGAPLNWAILSDLKETGLTMFQVGDGVDDGPLFDQERFAIGPRTHVAELIGASRSASASMIQRSLPGILTGALKPQPQAGEPSYCLQRTPEDGRIDWSASFQVIDRLVRAVSRPYPGGLCVLDGREIAIHRTEYVSPNLNLRGAPGQLANLPSEASPIVVCGEGCLRVAEAEFEDGVDAMPMLRASSNKRFAKAAGLNT
jgi:methionyl-tRNA formyltransferase